MKPYIVLLFSYLILLAACGTQKEHEGHKHETVTQYYTCSMDPQVIETKPGKCPICKMDLTPISADQLHTDGIKLSEQQEQLANIKTTQVKFDYVDNHVYATGIVKENENTTYLINARLQGRVEKLRVKTNGYFIKKGEVLYELYSEELNSTQRELIFAWKKWQEKPEDVLLVSMVKAAEQKLELWGVSSRQIQRIQKATDVLTPFPIESPFSGFVKNNGLTEGANIMAGDVLFELSNYTSLWVDAQFYPNETMAIQEGNVVDIEIEGNEKALLQGKVIQVLPQVSSNSMVNMVRILIEPNSAYIQPGMQANVYWHQTSEKALVIPVSAILRDSQGASVWVKNKDGKYESRMIHLSAISGTNASVHHGLIEGEKVVTSGAYLLQSEYVFKKGINPMAGHDM